MKNRIAAIQMNSGNEVTTNLKQAEELISQSVEKRAELIVLPEMFSIMGKSDNNKIQVREKMGSGLIQDFLADQAHKYKIWIVGGTIPIEGSDPNRIKAACFVFNDEGKAVARYDKIHLFDVLVGNQPYKESNSTEPGNETVVIETPVGKLGLMVCYDLRFPELARNLIEKGAEIIAIPTAFTQKTGEAHWEILVRAAAVQCQCYIIAACQDGTHPSGRQTYGDSMIIDPWGKIIDRIPKGLGVITGDINLSFLYEIRNNIPVHLHRRNDIYLPQKKQMIR